jgi:hypothetical protein
VSTNAVCPGGSPKSCLPRSMALGSSFPPDIGPNDECRLSSSSGPSCPRNQTWKSFPN